MNSHSSEENLLELTQLLDDFDALTRPPNDTTLFSELFDKFESIQGPLPSSSNPEIARAEFELFFGEFDKLWPAYLEAQAEFPPAFNIWRVAGLGSGEVRNCRVLCWLLDPNETHSQGNRFLKCLLDVMGEPVEIADDVHLTVKREESALMIGSRVDILIETTSCVVCIEAKVLAQEDETQLARYFSGVGVPRSLQGKRFIGKLLSLQGARGETITEGFTRLLWADVAKALRMFAGAQDAYVARSLFIRELAQQYARFIDKDLLSSM